MKLKPILFVWSICAICVAGALTLFATPVTAQNPSLWQRRDVRTSNLFADVTAKRPGDLLFVTIQEQSDVQNRDNRLMRKQNDSSSNASGTYGIGGGLGSANGNLSLDHETAANRAFTGNAQYISEREFIDQFTVMVVDTLPNGNLLVSGTRNVSLEGDNRVLILSGVVRSVDVDRTNSISSKLVANLTIGYAADSRSPEGKFVNQGWFAKRMNRIWPH